MRIERERFLHQRFYAVSHVIRFSCVSVPFVILCALYSIL
nr:MAG TPA: hypothetical protein [Caudoviricetes sp.]